jgi:lysophospholipase L1-like esterase
VRRSIHEWLTRGARLGGACGLAAVLLGGGAGSAGTAEGPASAAHWVATWAASPQLTEPSNLPPAPGFDDVTLRQRVRVSIAGSRVRVRFSNAFGRTALTLQSARIARSQGASAIDSASDRPLTFQGRTSVTIPEGALMVSDPFTFELPALADVALSVHLKAAPAEVTGHPGSRTTSYLRKGDAVAAPDLPDAVPVDHWYFIGGIDVEAEAAAAAVAVLGDSITDGRGSTTNGNDRWTDNLARRLQGDPRTARVAVLNHGLGGNRLLRDGLGPNALARLDRDVLAQPGVRWLVVLEGVNDIGTRISARAKGEPWATAEDIVAAYEQIITRARARGIRVYGATILPFEGFAAYWATDTEADRQAVNRWIRASGRFDGVIDFDAVARDPARPSRLRPEVDGGDHLHPSAQGYRIMAEAVDLSLFAAPSADR